MSRTSPPGFRKQPLKKILGKDVAINYKIGGGGALCWSELVQTKPDGYVIAGHNLPHIALQPLEMGNAGYKTLDLKNIYMFESTPNLLLVRNDSPYKSLKDFVEAAKKGRPRRLHGRRQRHIVRQRPGHHHAQRRRPKIQLTYVPFGGTGSAVPALLGEPRDRPDELLHHGDPVRG